MFIMTSNITFRRTQENVTVFVGVGEEYTENTYVVCIMVFLPPCT